MLETFREELIKNSRGGLTIEIFDIYDKNRNKTGRTAERGTPLKPDEYRMVVHACIFNSNNEMLIQRRQPFKKSWPNMWDVSVGGCSIAGETSNDAITREVKEELGIDVDFTNIRPKFTFSFNNGFDDWYIIKMDLDLSKVTLQEEEVQEVKWATKDEILAKLKNSEFINYYESLIELCFNQIGDRYGVHKDDTNR